MIGYIARCQNLSPPMKYKIISACLVVCVSGCGPARPFAFHPSILYLSVVLGPHALSFLSCCSCPLLVACCLCYLFSQLIIQRCNLRGYFLRCSRIWLFHPLCHDNCNGLLKYMALTDRGTLSRSISEVTNNLSTSILGILGIRISWAHLFVRMFRLAMHNRLAFTTPQRPLLF